MKNEAGRTDSSRMIILGSTGSVGTQALDVAEQCGIEVEAISGHKNISLLEMQVRKYRPAFCLLTDDTAYRELSVRCADTGTEFLSGKDALKELLDRSRSQIVLNAITGQAGLLPTLEILKRKKRLALANKESLVIAGALVRKTAREHGAEIIPVDSEHSAIFQCIGAESGRSVKRIILTASGGRFYGCDRKTLDAVTPEQALAHPTWKMGPRITVDSSTMMNKGFEVIEAVWLFGMPLDAIEVVIQRESIIHSMVEYIDNAVLAQLGTPDMRLCIQYAVTYPERAPSPVAPLDFSRISSLSFGTPDDAAFPCLELARAAFRQGGVATAALNAADEVAVSAFLDGHLKFTGIPEVIERVVSLSPVIDDPTLNDYIAADAWARQTANKLIGGLA